MHIVQIQIREQRSSISSITSIKETSSLKESRPPTPSSVISDTEGDDKPPVPGTPGGKSTIPKGQRPPKKGGDAPPSGGGRRYAPQPPPDPKQQLHFIAFLTDRTIPEGGKTKISCYVEGPDPQARWFKGNLIHDSYQSDFQF